MNNRTVILGWGSLIYQLGNLKKNIELPWNEGGPKLPIEFSRISTTRNQALTLVIDPENGVEIPTQYIRSKRKDPRDVANDLCNREGTVIRHIGLIDTKKSYNNFKFPKVAETIRKWLDQNRFRAVVWTDLPSNFDEKLNTDFSIEEALNHLNGLPNLGKKSAKDYFKNAPAFINTPLRKKLISKNWY